MIRRTAVSLFVAAFAIVPSASLVSMAVNTPTAMARDKDCSDFKTQAKAQRYFRKHHPRRDPSGLDADHDGIACEDNRCPCNHHKPHGFERPKATAQKPARRLGAAPSEVMAARRDRSPEVICITRYGGPSEARGAYRYKPRRCEFHKKGEFPVFHANTTVMLHLHWHRWDDRQAKAKGKIGISTAGAFPARAELKHVRFRCGRYVYTKLNVHYREGGKTHHFAYKIDNCLR